jgi:hypothetical protein
MTLAITSPRTADQTMTPRERFIAALERRPLTGRVPHFELVFFLTMEAFGKVHPSHRNYAQWDQMDPGLSSGRHVGGAGMRGGHQPRALVGGGRVMHG